MEALVDEVDQAIARTTLQGNLTIRVPGRDVNKDPILIPTIPRGMLTEDLASAIMLKLKSEDATLQASDFQLRIDGEKRPLNKKARIDKLIWDTNERVLWLERLDSAPVWDEWASDDELEPERVVRPAQVPPLINVRINCAGRPNLTLVDVPTIMQCRSLCAMAQAADEWQDFPPLDGFVYVHRIGDADPLDNDSSIRAVGLRDGECLTLRATEGIVRRRRQFAHLGPQRTEEEEKALDKAFEEMKRKAEVENATPWWQKLSRMELAVLVFFVVFAIAMAIMIVWYLKTSYHRRQAAKMFSDWREKYTRLME